MEYKPGRTDSYRFTINMSDPKDIQALRNLREDISRQNQNTKEKQKRGYLMNQPILRVRTMFRAPEFNHPLTMGGNQSGTKYLRGGSVRKEQKPSYADVYIHHRRD